MLLNAYSIFDLKALVYHTPFYLNTDAAAVRAMADLVQDSNTAVGRHPADYVLYCVGTFNDATAELSPVAPRRHVADAVSLLPSPQSDLFRMGGGFKQADGTVLPFAEGKF